MAYVLKVSDESLTTVDKLALVELDIACNIKNGRATLVGAKDALVDFVDEWVARHNGPNYMRRAFKKHIHAFRD